MTPAEKLAVFMGWERLTKSKDEYFYDREFSDGHIYGGMFSYPNVNSPVSLRVIEDEIARRGWRDKYACYLSEGVTGYCYTHTHNGANNTPAWEACLSATCPQRVAALLRTIEAMGGGK